MMDKDEAMRLARDLWIDMLSPFPGFRESPPLVLVLEAHAKLAPVVRDAARTADLERGIRGVLIEAGVGTLTSDGGKVEYCCAEGGCDRDQTTGAHEEGCLWGELAALLDGQAQAPTIPSCGAVCGDHICGREAGHAPLPAFNPTPAPGAGEQEEGT